MNERIIEFAEQCEGITICECGSTGFNYEKFAMMIISECADIAYKTAWYDLTHSEPESMIPSHIYNTIKKHFGVKE